MKMYVIVSLLLCFSVLGRGQSISATGSWSASAAGTLTEAGQNFPYAIASSSVQSLVSVAGVNPLPSWTVLVHRQDLLWPSNLSIWVRKTGDGNCSGSGCILVPSATSPYIQVQNNTQTFFTGVRTHSSIPIQYEIRGLSVLIPVNDYSTNLIYTLIEM